MYGAVFGKPRVNKKSIREEKQSHSSVEVVAYSNREHFYRTSHRNHQIIKQKRWILYDHLINSALGHSLHSGSLGLSWAFFSTLRMC